MAAAYIGSTCDKEDYSESSLKLNCGSYSGNTVLRFARQISERYVWYFRYRDKRTCIYIGIHMAPILVTGAWNDHEKRGGDWMKGGGANWNW